MGGVGCAVVTSVNERLIACSVSSLILMPSPDGHHCSLIGCFLFILHRGVNCMFGVAEVHVSAGFAA